MSIIIDLLVARVSFGCCVNSKCTKTFVVALPNPARLITVHVYSPPTTGSSVNTDELDRVSFDLSHWYPLSGPPEVEQVRMTTEDRLKAWFTGDTDTLPSGDTGSKCCVCVCVCVSVSVRV